MTKCFTLFETFGMFYTGSIYIDAARQYNSYPKIIKWLLDDSKSTSLLNTPDR